MIAEESLKDLLSNSEYSRQDKILICLAVDSASPKEVARVRQYAIDAGATEAKKWNISDILSRARGLAIRTKDGWELTSAGRKNVAELSGAFSSTVAPRVAASLRHHLTKVSDEDTRKFVEEAVRCFEARLYRAAIVLSWVGTVALLQDHVLKNHLTSFNAEASRRNSKWKSANTRDDLSRMKEYDFLQHLEGISIIGKSVKNELEKALKLRNGAGHPNSLSLGEATVAAHLETLILNVFEKF